MSDIWIEKRFGVNEINLGTDPEVIVNCSANQIIEIDKLFGPLAALGVRIRLEYTSDVSDWVVEREAPSDPKDSGKETKWIEMARWDCQLDWWEPNC